MAVFSDVVGLLSGGEGVGEGGGEGRAAAKRRAPPTATKARARAPSHHCGHRHQPSSPSSPAPKAHLLDAAHVEVLEEAAVRHARRRDGVVVVVGAGRGGGQQRGHRAEHAVAFFLRWVVVFFLRSGAQLKIRGIVQPLNSSPMCVLAGMRRGALEAMSKHSTTHRSAAAQQRAAHGAPQRRRRATHTPRVARGPPRLLPARLARISRAPGQELAALAIDGLLLLLLWAGEERESEKVSVMCVRPEKIAVSRSLAPHDVSLPRCVPASVSPAAGREQRRRSSAAEGAPGLCACEERVAKKEGSGQRRVWCSSCCVLAPAGPPQHSYCCCAHKARDVMSITHSPTGRGRRAAALSETPERWEREACIVCLCCCDVCCCLSPCLLCVDELL